MKGTITLNIAISLDGFIADLDGGYGWIAGQGDDTLDTEKELRFDDFLAGVDVVVMGNRSYQQGFAKDHSAKKVYVAASTAKEDAPNLRFINGDIVSVILAERDAGKHVYLFGGGIVVDPFIKANVIDEYIIGIIPVILGNGRPLFLNDNPSIPLSLCDYSIRDGVTVLRYIKRERAD